MREIEIKGNTFECRALTRGEVKALKKRGFNLNHILPKDADDCMDAVFEVVFTADEIKTIDGFAQHEAMKLWNGILRETYGAKDEEKNS